MKRVLPVVVGVLALGLLAFWVTSTKPLADSPMFSDDQTRTLRSLEKLTDHPLYVMHYYGSYQGVAYSTAPNRDAERPAWACTLFAAMGDPSSPVYGRNFDWPRHPALILIAEPPDAFASVSMVDLSFLTAEDVWQEIHLLPPERLSLLLETPLWTFDGMNERGVAVGMAAVQDSEMPHDESLRTVGSLEVMRRVLDSASTVDEAIGIFEHVNIDMTGGPCLHYLVADATGNSALIEFWEGRSHVLRFEAPWACATNYRLCRFGEAARPGICWRYDTVFDELRDTGGALNAASAMDLLRAAHQGVPDDPEIGTQWSIVYDMKSGTVELAVGHRYEEIFRFRVPTGASSADGG